MYVGQIRCFPGSYDPFKIVEFTGIWVLIRYSKGEQDTYKHLIESIRNNTYVIIDLEKELEEL